jgi:Alpha/beta hydrolase domain
VHFWELAGAPHLEANWFTDLAADVNKSTPGFVIDPCDGPPGVPGVVHGPASRAALHALRDWSLYGGVAAPASAPRLSMNVGDPADFDVPVTFNRDPNTNLVLGGIRLPAMSVPIGTLLGDRAVLDPATLGPGGQCYFTGAFDPWNHDADPWDGQPGFDPSPSPEPDLKALYGSHQNYVERVVGASLKAVSLGYLRPLDAAKLGIGASKAQVP